MGFVVLNQVYLDFRLQKENWQGENGYRRERMK